MRRKIEINENWFFTKERPNLIAPDFSAMQEITLPHTWNAEDGADGDDYYDRRECWYVRKLERPQGDEIYLEVPAASQTAHVYLNGAEIGYHIGGFSLFRIRLTERLEEKENILAIAVDNSESQDTYPQFADFTFFGGLYRGVNLLVVPERHFELEEYGGPGIYVTSHLNEDGKAEVLVQGKVSGGQSEAYKVQIRNGEGEIILEENTEKPEKVFFIDNPRVWNGKKDPYLYTAKMIMEGSGDEVSTRFGIREFYVDSETGFFLNQESYPLRGVSRHQDRQGKGWAISEEDQREDAMLIHEIGATAVRLAHYQHAQSFYDFCDELGMVVWAEIPFISRFINTKEAKEDTVRQMRELIMQNYNHPSICFWGISNEITMGGESDELVENQRILQKLCHKLDPSRKTVLANLTTVESQSEQNKITDLSAYNVYMGWYAGKVEDCGAWMDSLHKENSDMCMGISEYGADTNVQYHSDAPKRQDYTEEYQSYYHEKMLQAIQERPYLWCSFVWNMFDFAADKRKEGGTQGRNTKGLVTYDRKIKKDAFYLYKAYWTEKPFVHICSKRFQKRPGDTTTIKVYATGIEKAELWMDGKRIQEQKGTHCFLFEGIKLTQNHQITIYGYCGDEKVCEDEAAFTHTDGLEAEYILESGENDGVNWFLDEYGEKKKLEATPGFLSVYDEIGTILDTEKGNEILNGLFISFGEGGKALLTESVQNSIRSLTFVELAKMIGPAITPEMLNMLNEQLRHVKNS